MKTITAYKCEYCSKKLEVKHAMEHHENWCKNNPKNDTLCLDCINLKKELIYESYNDDYENTVNIYGYKCIKTEKLLFPAKVKRLKLDKRHPDTFKNQEQMPHDCNKFIAKPIEY